MSNLIPEGWEQNKLGKYIGIQGGNAFKSEAFAEKGVPVVRISNIKKDGSVNLDGSIFVSQDESLNRFKVQFGDTLIAMSGATTGKVGRYYLNSFSYLNQRVGRFFVKNDKISMDYIHQITAKDSFVLSILIDAIGGAQPNISNLQIESITALFPPLPEQQKIAAILTSVDEVIEKTQAQIDKLKDLKTAMMQELLLPTDNGGVGTKQASADAALNNSTACRESYIPHTEFKDSPVGRIPKSWDCVQLESLLQSSKNSMRSGPFGSALLKHELVPNGHPYLGIDNVHIERFENKFKRYVSDEKFEQLKKYAVKENDVMITIMGTVGRSCVVPKGVGKALSSKHVWTMTFDQTKYISTLICWQLNYSDWVKLQFKNESQGGVMESISSRTLKELWLPRPPIQEQKKINEAHSSLSGAIRIKEALLNKHQLLKKALMQDLLTGKVRVKVEE